MIPVVPPKKDPNVESVFKTNGSKIKKAVEDKVNAWADSNIKIGKMAMIAGGIAFAGYILFDIFTKKNKKKKLVLKTENTKLPNASKPKESWIVSSIKGYILAFLISIAKEKLLEALSHLKEEEDKTLSSDPKETSTIVK